MEPPESATQLRLRAWLDFRDWLEGKPGESAHMKLQLRRPAEFRQCPSRHLPSELLENARLRNSILALSEFCPSTRPSLRFGADLSWIAIHVVRKSRLEPNFHDMKKFSRFTPSPILAGLVLTVLQIGAESRSGDPDSSRTFME